MKNIAVFVSGGGTDMQSIIDAERSGRLKAKVALVIASKDNIFAIERAKNHNIPYTIFKKRDYSSLNIMYEKILEVLAEYKIDFIVLAGYLNILTPNIVRAYNKRIINIHPSLIPKYCGMGFYGMKVHEAVIQNKEKISGATVHYVDEGADTGEIIAQKTVEIEDTDTPETLSEKVLEAEHLLLPETLIKLLNEEKK